MERITIAKPKPIPTTRVWYKDFKEIMEEKCKELEQKTWIQWVRGYDDKEKLPFKLYWDNFEAGFKTDGELFECIYWMLWGLEFKASILREFLR